MTKIILTKAAALGAGLMLALPALADHRDDGYAEGGSYADARVVHVEPIVRLVRVSDPRRECWDEDYYVERGGDRRHGDTAGATVLGGIIGGAIGNAVGRGRGRDAATIAGVLIGSAVGHDRAVRDGDRGARELEPRTRTRCWTDDRWHEEERIDGYRVTYEYDGRRYQTRMSRDPGATVKVWVSVRPVGY
jgi:uncharacterized protein YcfJ